jgi:hypothetical protein
MKSAQIGKAEFAQPSGIDDIDMKANRVDAPALDSGVMRVAQQSATPDLPTSQQPESVKEEVMKHPEVDQLEASTDRLDKTIDEIEGDANGPLITKSEESQMVSLSKQISTVESHVKQLSQNQNRIMQEDDKWMAMQAIVEMIAMLIRKLTGTLHKNSSMLASKINDPEFKAQNPKAYEKAVENQERTAKVQDMAHGLDNDMKAKIKEKEKQYDGSELELGSSPTPK